jgi:hypothetical protein
VCWEGGNKGTTQKGLPDVDNDAEAIEGLNSASKIGSRLPTITNTAVFAILDNRFECYEEALLLPIVSTYSILEIVNPCS